MDTMAVEWMPTSFVFSAVGFLLVALAMAGADHGGLTGVGGAVEALEICGFVAFLASFGLTAMIKFGQIKNTTEVTIAYVTCSYLAVVFIVIGLGVFGSKATRKPPAYVTTLLVCGGLLATLAGTFGVLELTGL